MFFICSFSPSVVMSCRLFFLLFLLRVQSIDLTHARSFSSLSDFDLPELDGSAVDTCRIFPDPVPDTTTRRTATTTTTPTTLTRKQVVATTKKPAVQTPRKPETKSTRTPIRPQPVPAGPIIDHNSAAKLLQYLLANSRRHATGSLPWFNGLSQPMGGPPQRGYSSSDSDESIATLLKRVGRTGTNRRKIFSSEDSSDES